MPFSKAVVTQVKTKAFVKSLSISYSPLQFLRPCTNSEKQEKERFTKISLLSDSEIKWLGRFLPKRNTIHVRGQFARQKSQAIEAKSWSERKESRGTAITSGSVDMLGPSFLTRAFASSSLTGIAKSRDERASKP